MITLIDLEFKNLTQEKYDDLIDRLPLYQIQCSCGHAGGLVRHTHYYRKLKRRKGTISLKVLRVKCKYCGTTHAILCEQIVPYEQIPVNLQQEMILFKMGSSRIQKVMEGNPEITESDIRAVKRRFKQQWKERLLTMGHRITDRLEDLIQSAFSIFHRQFMQIRRGINLEFSVTHLT